jgi:cytochrome c
MRQIVAQTLAPAQCRIWPLIGVLAAALSACANPARDEAIMNTHGNPDRGQSAIEHYGCTTCHTIPGVSGPDVLVGPRLDHVVKQAYIAGVLTNTPDNLIRWIEHPTRVDSLTAMPDLGVTPDDARDIAAYLYSR